MTIQTSYMGTKRRLAPWVAKIISKTPTGPLLDVFSGVCTIGAAVGPDRQVWSNDIQYFSANVGAALFTSSRPPLNVHDVASLLRPFYKINHEALVNRFGTSLVNEQAAFNSGVIDRVRSVERRLPFIGSDRALASEARQLKDKPCTFPYRLFAITFAGSYFSLAQCIQIDSIRYSIEALYRDKKIDLEQRRWLCLALCEAARKISTTTGHFAQFLQINSNNRRRFISQRNRSTWKEWLVAIEGMAPIGAPQWRAKNRSFRAEATKLLADLRTEKRRPAVIYADPPYTEDQYSRYYHIYETLMLYDYPSAEGHGRYRGDRFVSDFCLASRVRDALGALAQRSASLRCTLVLSYPKHGLLKDPEIDVRDILSQHFSRSISVESSEHFHSTMGASKGSERHAVHELLFVAS